MSLDIMRPLPKEPDPDPKKKTSKSKKIRGTDHKLDISHPTGFKHTLHVGFNENTGEFTVSTYLLFIMYIFGKMETNIS